VLPQGFATEEIDDPVTNVDFTRLQHINAIVNGYDDSIDHFRRLFGAQLNLEIHRVNVDICLINIGRVIFELSAPKPGHDGRRTRSLEMFGDHYSGVEYQVRDLAAAKEILQSKGLRILVDGTTHFVTNPADSFGAALEVYEGDWHAEPPPVPFIEPMQSREYWSDIHPLGLLGIKRYSIAVRNCDDAAGCFQNLTGCSVAYRADRPGVAATSIGLQIGDSCVELIAPVRAGPLRDYIDRYGERIRATTFAVRDLAEVDRYFAGRGVRLVSGDAADTSALAPEDNHGLRFEFSE
jgi:hypothetical protein